MTSCNLTDKNCVPCEGGVPALTAEEVAERLQQLDGWTVSDDNKSLFKAYKFKGFLGTMNFVNAVAWVANKEKHHPDLKVGYNYCDITFTTHAIDGLSENDFICAAKVDAL